MANRPVRNNRNPNCVNRNNNEDANSPPRVSLSREDLMAITTIVATTLQGLATSSANQNPNPLPEVQLRGIKYYYESLRKNRAPMFDGNPDPEVGQNWLKNIEAQLRLLEIPEVFKVDVVTPFLEDKACKWWEIISPTMTKAGPVTTIKEMFLKQYYLTEFRLQKLSEFENFTQAPGMPVLEYTSKFNSLQNGHQMT
ncbi:uncharacterized protein LOC122048416 [Zingiber officinale]|uniref:uncharacterized protein LOC122048416 n=1 Tax=Zingiber officinale TaxID=94328 RepID=UPI001C4B2D18|nr:uncharacterized protein LOC122048416 [Zingiber officinale]